MTTCVLACYLANASKWSIAPCSDNLCHGAAVLATGSFTDTLNSTGWGHLTVEGDAVGLGAQAMGVVEGYLTASHIASAYLNNMQFTFNCLDTSCVPRSVTRFMEAQEKWTRAQIAKQPDDKFWQAVGGLMAQYDGMQTGLELAGVTLPGHWRWLLNGIGDLFQIVPAVEPSRRLDWGAMSREEKRAALRGQGHCSGLVKVLPGLEDLYMGHSSWFEYADMDRIYKYYSFSGEGARKLLGVDARVVSFSSYPGYLESLDDFYMMSSGLGMVQTSNGVPNNTLLELITHDSLLAWQRVRTASLLATSGREWYETFRTAASGTYVNQYMVVDFNKFSPGKPLPSGVLWVVEEIPGLVEGADQTPTLARGYWPSYNVPYYAEVYRRSGYAGAFDSDPSGPAYDGGGEEYTVGAPRAALMRELHGTVMDQRSFQNFMRYANYSNPYSVDAKGNVDYGAAICMRGDLEDGGKGKAGGCYDSKITSYNGAGWSVRQLQARVVNGPSSSASMDGSVLAPFAWRPTDASHVGLPPKMAFPWATVSGLGLQHATTPPPSADPAARSALVVEVLLGGGVPDPTVRVPVSEPLLAALIGRATGNACESSRVLGFLGWRLLSGREVRGVAAWDELVFAQPGFRALSEGVRAHVKAEAARLVEACGGQAAAAAVEQPQDEQQQRQQQPQQQQQQQAPALPEGKCARTPIRGPDDATRVHYAPNTDDDGCFRAKQQQNNCYNYGNDVVTDTFAQPGRGSGVCKHHARPCVPNTCADVRRAAESDGLVWQGTKLPAVLPAHGHYVSLHIWPSENFHWLRMDADLKWSHKPGGAPVRNVDNDGKIITNPAKANVSPWSEHCGYMLTVPSTASLC